MDWIGHHNDIAHAALGMGRRAIELAMDDKFKARLEAGLQEMQSACLTQLSTTHRPRLENLMTLKFPTFENASGMTG